MPVFGSYAELVNGDTYTADTGSDRLLCALVIANGGSPAADPIDVTFGGVTLTKVHHVYDTGKYHLGLYYLKDADILTGAQVLNVNWATSVSPDRVVIWTATGVDQSTPIGSSAEYTNNATTIITSSALTVAENDLVMAAAGVSSGPVSLTDPAGYSNYFYTTGSEYVFRDRSIAIKDITSGGTESPEFTMSASAGGVGVFAVIKGIAAPADVEITSVNGGSPITNGLQNVVTTGSNFEASQAGGSMSLVSGAISSDFTIDTWSDGSIQGDTVQGNIPFTTASWAVSLEVTNDAASSDSVVVQFNPENDTSVIELLNPVEGDGHVNITGTPATTDQYHYTGLYESDGVTPAGLVLNFDGSTIYGELTDPVTFAGDYEIEVVFNTTANTVALFGETSSNDTLLYVLAGGALHARFGGGATQQGTTIVNDGEDHTARMVRDGTATKLYVDGVLDVAGVEAIQDADVNLIGKNQFGLYFEGQIKSIEFIDKSGPSDVISKYQINNGSTTSIPIDGGGAEAITLYNVESTDWTDPYTVTIDATGAITVGNDPADGTYKIWVRHWSLAEGWDQGTPGTEQIVIISTPVISDNDGSWSMPLNLRHRLKLR